MSNPALDFAMHDDFTLLRLMAYPLIKKDKPYRLTPQIPPLKTIF